MLQNRWGTEYGTTEEGWHTLTTSDGKTSIVSLHLRDSRREEVTYDRLLQVLNHWALRGAAADRHGEQSIRYYGFVPGVNHVLRVSVSIDDSRIVSGFIDSQATGKLAAADWSYFARKLRDMEVNDDFESS